MKCYVHNDVDAVGTCTSCGRNVCPTCAIEAGGKITCKACVEKMMARPQPAAVPPSPAAPVAPAAAPQAQKSPVVAAILSFLIPGLGQILNSQVKKGVVVFLGNVLLWAVLLFLYFFGNTLLAVVTMGFGSVLYLCCLPSFVLPLFLNVWAALDAYGTAKKYNLGQPVGDWL